MELNHLQKVPVIKILQVHQTENPREFSEVGENKRKNPPVGEGL